MSLYDGIGWKNGREGGTPLSAENLNKMDKAIVLLFKLLAEVKDRLVIDDKYEIDVTEIDAGTGLHQLQIKSLEEENGFSIFTIKAPESNATEATMTLLCVEEEGICQFVDVSCLGPFPGSWDGRGTFEIVLQSRGNTKLPPAILAFNNGTAGRVKKLVVYPDAIPMEFTSQGIKIRKNNNFDNSGTEDEFETVNLLDIHSVFRLNQNSVQYSPVTDLSLYAADICTAIREVVLMYNWDLTASLTDTIAGMVCQKTGCTSDVNGIQFSSGAANLYLGKVFGVGRVLEVDIASMEKGFGDSVHGRFLMIYEDGSNKSEGLVWRHQTQSWSFYVDGAWGTAISSNAAIFNGKTLKISSDANGYLSIYANDDFIGTSSVAFDSSKTHVCIGGYADSFYNLRITGVRVYG